METKGRASTPLLPFKPIIAKNSAKPLECDRWRPQFLYTFDISFHNTFHYEWIIQKTYKDFIKLQKSLHHIISNTPHKIPSKSKLYDLPIEDRLSLLEGFLQFIAEEHGSNPHFKAFLEVSELSFDGDTKLKEGYVQKRTGGRYGNEQKCCNWSKHFKRFQKRWVVLRKDNLAYLTDHSSRNLHEALMFKDNFVVKWGKQDADYDDGIRIITSRRNFIFRCGTVHRRDEWVDAISAALESSDWNIGVKRFDSSFPIRNHNRAAWYVDGEGYFNEVYHNLKLAKREVFITDWWLSPELYLKRPSNIHSKTKLVDVLGTLADRGVSVFVHVYKEFSMALTLNSLHTQQTLTQRNPNIKVVRHPHRSVVGGVFLWSHHEKIICIDQEIAFIGGLDLCYGRMDNHKHLLTDPNEPYYWNGIDYSNVRVADFTDVANWQRDTIDRKEVPRMPWHDVALKVVGNVAGDIALHFIDLWNHVMTDITGIYTKNKELLEPNARREEAADPEMSSLSIESMRLSQEIKIDELRIEEIKNEEVNKKKKDGKKMVLTITPAEETKTSQFLQIPQARKSLEPPKILPRSVTSEAWIKREFTGIEVAPRTSSLSQISRIDVKALDKKMSLSPEDMIYNAEVLTKASQNPLIQKLVENILPKEIDEALLSPFRQKTAEAWKALQDKELREKLEVEDETIQQKEIQAEGEAGKFKRMLTPSHVDLDNLGTCECQIVRSAGLWSYGLEDPEHSIHMAYLSLINQADHFIYIENQFFISSTAGSPVKNQIAQALVDRIKVAAARKEKFRIIVVCPLLPGFEGGVEDAGSSVLRLQLYWEYQTISRNSDSIYEQLLKDENIKNPLEYIQFYGLRNHAMLGSTPVTEIVYVHSKLMIVDDDVVIMGSANINDRSQLGVRDSEIAMVINDTEKIMTVLAGEAKRVSKFAHELRMNIFKEIMGTTDERLVRDPLSEEFTSNWQMTAETNTALYREIFGCYPDDNIKSFAQIRTLQEKSDLSQYSSKKHLFKGFLVQFPLEFLFNEDLRLALFNKKSILTKEFIIPQESFV